MASRVSKLYRSILRAHKQYLPSDMRGLGDTYVKSEFRLHKTAKPEQAEQFLSSWDEYLQQILRTARAHQSRSTGAFDDSTSKGSTHRVFEFGADLSPDLEFSEEQQAQLEKLKEEASKVGNSTSNTKTK